MMGKVLLHCECISDTTTSGTRNILLTIKGTADIPNSISNGVENDTFYCGIYSIDNEIVDSNLFGEISSLNINNTGENKPTKDDSFGGWIFKTIGDIAGQNNSNFIKSPFYIEQSNIIIIGSGFNITINWGSLDLTAVYIAGVCYLSSKGYDVSQEEHDKLSYLGNEISPMPIIYYRDSLALTIGEITSVTGFDVVPVGPMVIMDALTVNCPIKGDQSAFIYLYKFGMHVLGTNVGIPFDITGTSGNRLHQLYSNPFFI